MVIYIKYTCVRKMIYNSASGYELILYHINNIYFIEIYNIYYNNIYIIIVYNIFKNL